jgi:translation initiation factor 2B subunit (eIF-2B alpha/beta/delta family)
MEDSPMSQHPEVKALLELLRTGGIGGAADTAKAVVQSLTRQVQESKAKDGNSLLEEVERTVVDILRAMSSIAPPINALHRLMTSMEKALEEEASVEHIKNACKLASDEFFVWIESALTKVAQYGAEKIEDGGVIFTYSMSSTVWGILRLAKSQGKSFRLIVTESRPGNEGLWTATEMDKIDVPVSVGTDACVGQLVPLSNVVFVGADAISSCGACLCKVGTYPSALVAKAHGVPFYVAADSLKFDTTTLLGFPFRVHPIQRHRVLSEEHSKRIQAAGESFEETPPDLVTALITEMGLLSPPACVSVMWRMNLSKTLNKLLPAWVSGEL